ncbi:MAG: K(+)-transporting ATPase subunit C [Acidimicrobiales bacterium]
MRSSFVAQLVASLRIVAVMTVVLGVIYPLAVTVFAQVAVGGRADGQLVEVDGTVVGSRLIGQAFTGDEYFEPRPSAAGYDAASSAGSNLGPTNPDLIGAVTDRVTDYRARNGLAEGVPVPVDAVTASGSGLDPDISPANARLQAPRVAAARGIGVMTVLELVDEHTDHRPLGVLGDDAVNVLELNLALDTAAGSP